MAKTLTDLSQLTKAILKESLHPAQSPEGADTRGAADERFDNLDVCKLHDRVFRFGFGVKERRKIPFVKRNIYRNNCGVLYPLDDFRELSKARAGDVCAAKLRLHRKRYGW